jgi:membrane protease YdiL (CAAX protease family)
MTSSNVDSVASPLAGRGFWPTVRRLAPLRLLVSGFVLLVGLGLTTAFHFEYAKGRLGLPYSPLFDWLGTVGLCAALLGIYALLVRLFEARWPREAAPRPRLLGLGVLIGVGLVCTVYAIYAAVGVAHFGGVNGFDGVGEVLLVAVLAAIGEEVLFRGVLFRVLEDSLGTLLALILSAALFGLMHAGNEGATTFSSVAVALEAGAMLASAYVWSRSLWLPIGIHLAWNFTLGGIFTGAVSGGQASGLLQFPLSKTAHPLVTGGAFGPEGSLVAVTVCVGVGLVFCALAIRAGRWRRPTFRLLLE